MILHCLSISPSIVSVAPIFDWRRRSICLSDKSYGLEAAEALVPTLAQMSSLTHADVSDIIAGRHEDIAKQVMRTIAAPLAALPGLTSLVCGWQLNAHSHCVTIHTVLSHSHSHPNQHSSCFQLVESSPIHPPRFVSISPPLPPRQDWSSNAMGLKGIVAIERLLVERRASLQHLYFNNCGNEADAVEHIHKCLLPTEVRALTL